MGRGTLDRGAANAAMERYAGGDNAAFSEVYDAIAPQLLGYLRRQTQNGALAEDIVQQTLLHMHHARGHFIPGAQVAPWAFAIARRLMIDLLRRGKFEVTFQAELQPAGGEAPADELIDAKQLAARLQLAATKLPENQRVAFELIRQEGLSLGEVAQVLGVTKMAVKLRLHRANEALRSVLGDQMADMLSREDDDDDQR
jgi:RNA polymerase sigma-70 factor, ECF subfamily